MAIAVKLDDLLYDRRMTLTELADRIGITLANLSILKTGKARAIRFSTLDAICEALACQPGDILRFEPEQAEGQVVGCDVALCPQDHRNGADRCRRTKGSGKSADRGATLAIQR